MVLFHLFLPPEECVHSSKVNAYHLQFGDFRLKVFKTFLSLRMVGTLHQFALVSSTELKVSVFSGFGLSQL